MTRRAASAAAVAGLALVATIGAGGAPAAGRGRAPTIEQLVVFRSGRAIARSVSTRSVHVRVGRRRCVVGDGLPLAALVRSRPARIRLRDFGSCGRHARDSEGLFVAAVGRDRNRGQRGWVYKVGRRVATAGAASPTGPFGRGRLRSGQRVTWFYCREATRCQRTLAVRARVSGPGAVVARVVGYDDDGHGAVVGGATVRIGAAGATTGPDGRASLRAPAGRHRVVASKPGLVRSFPERVVVP